MGVSIEAGAISCAEIITEEAGLMGVLALPQNLDGKFYIFEK